jgi:hypothetical protein
MEINSKEVKLFSSISNDINKIHLDKEFASKFFIKEPIVHGANLAMKAISKFLMDKKRKIIITRISLNFKNFLLVNEKFNIKIFKNKIIIHNDFHTKLVIHLEYQISKLQLPPNKTNVLNKKINKLSNLNFNNLQNVSLINQLVHTSYFVGSINPGNGSLIFNIKIDFNKDYNSNFKPKIEKRINNISIINYQNNFYKIQIIASKLVPFKNETKRLTLTSKTLKKIKGKKILIFGPTSDLGKRINCNSLKNRGCKIFSHSFRINLNKPKISNIQNKSLIKKLIKTQPDFIFYFSSPKIYYDERKNLKLYNFYNLIFVHYFKKIVDILRYNKIPSKIFYPSTIFLNEKNKYKRYRSYLASKKMAEKICNSQENRKFVTCIRIPKLNTRSNYNLLGFYEGNNIKILDKYFDSFLRN